MATVNFVDLVLEGDESVNVDDESENEYEVTVEELIDLVDDIIDDEDMSLEEAILLDTIKMLLEVGNLSSEVLGIVALKIADYLGGFDDEDISGDVEDVAESLYEASTKIVIRGGKKTKLRAGFHKTAGGGFKKNSAKFMRSHKMAGLKRRNKPMSSARKKKISLTLKRTLKKFGSQIRK